MALPTYYSIGTVSVGAGGTTVTGVGTVWTGVIHEGDLFTDPATGTFSRVTADATSNTSLSINPWPGSALAGADYEVLITPDTARMQERTRIVLERLGELQQLGIQPNAFGPLSERDTYDNDPGGFIYLSIDDPWTLYIKESDASGDWDAGQPMEGAPGPEGPAGPPGADSTVPGPANELTIGTVTGGATADATITGTSPDQVLNLVLPQGAPGTDGTDGDDGDNGWSPVFAVASDSARRVLQVSDWTGGEGTEPASGLYVGPTGLTATIGDAVDIRGPQGASGSGSGDMEASVYDPQNIDADAFDRANHTGTQAASTITGLGTAAALNTGTASGNVPVLDGSGQLDTTVLPAIAITDVFTVANQAAMLALTAQRGDIAIRTDLNKSFALSTDSPSTLADWKELLTPTDVVLSVAGLTGAVSSGALKTALIIAQADVAGLTTASSPQFTGVNVGHASDTTLTRSAAGRLAVEGVGVTLSTDVREKLSANRTYYVRTDGNDSNTGLTNSSGGAFLTIQKAIDTIAGLDIGTFDVTIQVANGTYTGNVTVTGPWVGSGTVYIVGNITTPASVVLAPVAGDAITVTTGGRLNVRGVKVTSTGAGLRVISSSLITVDGLIDIGANSSYGCYAEAQGRIKFSANFNITGGGYSCFGGQSAGVVDVSGRAAALSGTPAFSGGFLNFSLMALLIGNSFTFTGSATGPRYSATTGGGVFTAGGGANVFPGSSAGTATSPGWYS